ncbi:unnamed protein product [Larinioides sclopetarius]|uniref:Uncharacterized protein n=1 Tax=Larinioides sclopetarius TaxID=280406 RepID=A0AAV1YTI9_9ARAC
MRGGEAAAFEWRLNEWASAAPRGAWAEHSQDLPPPVGKRPLLSTGPGGRKDEGQGPPSEIGAHRLQSRLKT